MKNLFEKELIMNGMTIKKMSRAAIKLTTSMQAVFADAPIHKLIELHEKHNDDFICHDGVIKIVVTK